MLELIQNWWCHKVLPLVYTDALSYYEVLGKLIQKLNETITNVNSLNENTVFTVNNIKPTSGNVDVGTVKSVNGSTPDENGNVNLPNVSGVTSVDDIGADAQGNVPLNAVKKVNNIAPDGTGNVNVGTVKKVNNKNPDEGGNVDVGTVKSINSTITPDAEGNIQLSAANVNAIPNAPGSVNTNNILNGAVEFEKLGIDAQGYLFTFLDADLKIKAAHNHKTVYADKATLTIDMNDLASMPQGWSCIIVFMGQNTTINLTLPSNVTIVDLINARYLPSDSYTAKNLSYLYLWKWTDGFWGSIGNALQAI